MKGMIILAVLFLSCIQLPAQHGCSVKKENFKPVIATLNPFFTDHFWDGYRKVEKARLDVHRSVVITQYGCKRHHKSIMLAIKSSGANTSEAFYIQEALTLMHMVYFGEARYASFKTQFENRFIKAFRSYGLGKEFNFPIGSSTFICSVRHDPTLGVQIRIEQATYVFAEHIQKAKDLTPRKDDDGWFKKE